MEQLIELSPFILGGTGIALLIAAATVRTVSEQKRQSKAYKTLNFIGFCVLFAAAAITVWTIMTSIHR